MDGSQRFFSIREMVQETDTRHWSHLPIQVNGYVHNSGAGFTHGQIMYHSSLQIEKATKVLQTIDSLSNSEDLLQYSNNVR